MQYWLMKSEPDVWSIDQQKKAGAKGAPWDGVRNYQAAKNLKSMKKGDLCFFYHSNIGKEIVGIVEVIKSLMIENEVSEIFSTGKIIPSAGQGIVSLQCRNNDKEVISILDKINNRDASITAHAERNVLKVLEGDCETAVGAHAIIEGDEIILEAELFSLDGSDRFYEKKSSKIENATTLGKEVGQILKTKSNDSYKK